MMKTTVYLPDELKLEVARVARSEGISEAEVIRRAVESWTARIPRQRPRGGLLHLGDPTLAERVDEVLAEGFGDVDR